MNTQETQALLNNQAQLNTHKGKTLKIELQCYSIKGKLVLYRPDGTLLLEQNTILYNDGASRETGLHTVSRNLIKTIDIQS